jgi:hypothetical protein
MFKTEHKYTTDKAMVDLSGKELSMLKRSLPEGDPKLKVIASIERARRVGDK